MRSLLTMPLLVDSHCDIAWNMLCFGRDYTRSAAETRRLEAGTEAVQANEDTLLGWPDWQRGRVCIVFGTLFAAPIRRQAGHWDWLCYSNPNEARALYRRELDAYHKLTETKAELFRLIRNRADLEAHMKDWARAEDGKHPVGIVVLMEGAEGVRGPEELGEWHEGGVRLIGLAWAGTRYSGGTKEPGPLTNEGRHLLRAMADYQYVLDLSHMDEPAALDAVDLYEGPVAATHVNCMALLPDFPTNRHFSDTALRKIIERDGVIANMPVNSFLKSGWSRSTGSEREEVPLDTFAAHIDHVCQLAGNSLHSAIGSDFDGGFGLQSVPPEIDTVADLPKVEALLKMRGYDDVDIRNIFSENWLRVLRRSLPG